MSISYSIFCHEHKLDLWIGQSGAGGRKIYYAEKHTMNALKEFLYAHQGCPLTFEGEQKYEDGYISIIPQEDGTLNCDWWNPRGDSKEFIIKKEEITDFMESPVKYIPTIK